MVDFVLHAGRPKAFELFLLRQAVGQSRLMATYEQLFARFNLPLVFFANEISMSAFRPTSCSKAGLTVR